MTSCIEAKFTRVSGFSSSYARHEVRLVGSWNITPGVLSCNLVDTGFSANVENATMMTATFGIVCSVGLGEYILWGTDGMILNVDGRKIYLTKKP